MTQPDETQPAGRHMLPVDDTEALPLGDARVGVLDDIDIAALCRAGARVTLRLDRGWPRIVIRSAPTQMVVLVTAARITDHRTNSRPTAPAVDRGEAEAHLAPVLVVGLSALVRLGDRFSVHWVTRRTDDPYSSLPPTQRTSATLTVHHSDGTLDVLGPVPGRYRTAPPGERTL